MTQRRRFTSAPGLMAALCCTTLTLACSGDGKSDAGASSGAGNMPSSGASGAGDAAGSAGSPPSSSGGSGSAGAGNASGAGAGGMNMASGGSTDSGGRAGSGAAAGTGAQAGSSGADPGGAGSGASAGANSAGQAGSAGAEWSSTFPTFTRHEIASFSAGYATAAVDIDQDGLLDVVALSSGSGGLVWFKNPAWTKFTITTAARQLIHMAPYDVDGDGNIDLALISDFDMNDSMGGGTVAWAEAPDDPTQDQDWALYTIDSVPTSHRLRFADIDGDGKKELIELPLFGRGSSAPAHAGAVELTAYAIPSDPKGAWTARVLDDEHLEVAHGIQIVDWDGDQADDILTAANDGVDLFRPSLAGEVEHLGAGAEGQAPERGSSEVALGSLGGERFIATIDPWHGTDAVIYTPGLSGSDPWTRLVLGSDFEHGHSLAAADFNGDGFDEVIAGGGQGAMTQLIYRYVPSSKTWDKIELDVGGVAVSAIDVNDINGDGALDIVAIGGSPTNNLVWYENTP